ncbi:hypothetical protein AB1N83_006504 [Pleurotus pulmonarius]
MQSTDMADLSHSSDETEFIGKARALPDPTEGGFPWPLRRVVWPAYHCY